MWKALAIAVLVIAVLAGAGAAALQRYDASRDDVIAEGIVVAGIDVGGMTAREARRVLERRLDRRLQRPIQLEYGERRFVLDPGLVHVRANPAEVVRTALAESRDGNFLTRSLRDLTGEGVDMNAPVEIDYSRRAVARVVAGLRREIDRPVREAKSTASFEGVHISESQVGVEVLGRRLEAAIGRRLVQQERPRTVAVPTRRVKPKTTTEELEKRYETFLAISRSRRELRLFEDQKLVRSYRVGIGAAGFATPAGMYEIESKAADPAWYVPNKPWAGELAGKVIPSGDPRNPIKDRWMGFHDGAGIHGTADVASVGTAASHGCIRMIPSQVIELYDRVPLHAPLYIA